MSHAVIERIVRAATLAPSLHNSQPWRFVAKGQRLDLFADPARALPVIDPDGRWMTVSCGAALLNAVVAARAAGRRCRIDLLCTADGSDRLATLNLQESSVPSELDVRLARAVSRRRTHRAPFAPGRLPPALVDELRHAAATDGCWSYTVDIRADVAEFSELLRRAEHDLRGTRAYRDELRAWVRELGADAPDGVPAEALPPGEPDRSASDVWLRDFTAGEAGEEPPAGMAASRVERPLVMVLGTAGDDRVAWLRAGMATERVLLTLTDGGAAASPLTHVLDLPEYRAALASLVGIEGRPQMMLRLGWPSITDRPISPRHDVADVLRFVRE